MRSISDDSNLHYVQFNGFEITVDLNESPYGKYIWDNVTNGKYEPDTFAFLAKNLNPDTILIDIGASDGPVTFFAASLGAKVIAYEPMPKIFSSLQKNLELNKVFSDSAIIKNSAVSNRKSQIMLARNSDTAILSPIVFTHQANKDSMINVESIVDVIREAGRIFPGKQIFLKIDIEGAEWKIFMDHEVINSFAKNRVTVLAALHPGFHRPPKKILRGINRVIWIFWRIENRRDFKRVFQLITNQGLISRTNLNVVTDERQFMNLVDHGCHEWIFDFSLSSENSGRN